MIPFVGLKIGFHDFDFEVEDSFFDEIDYSIIDSGAVSVHLNLEKKETMMIGKFSINGKVRTNCDRCNDPIEVPVKGNYQTVFKFGNEETDDEALVVLHPDTYELELKDIIYEFITVSLPTRLIHPKGECNEEMMLLLSEYTAKKEESDDDDEEWDEDEDDWDDDDEDWDDEEDDDVDDDNKPVDPRWSALKNLN